MTVREEEPARRCFSRSIPRVRGILHDTRNFHHLRALISEGSRTMNLETGTRRSSWGVGVLWYFAAVWAGCVGRCCSSGWRPSQAGLVVLEYGARARSCGTNTSSCPLVAQAASTEPIARPRLSSHANRIQASRRSRRIPSASRSDCSVPGRSSHRLRREPSGIWCHFRCDCVSAVACADGRRLDSARCDRVRLRAGLRTIHSSVRGIALRHRRAGMGAGKFPGWRLWPVDR